MRGTGERLHVLDYQLTLTPKALADLDSFWKWFRADNQAISGVLDSVLSQRIFLNLTGRFHSLLERVELDGLTGFLDYQQQLAAAKARLDEHRAKIFFGLVEVQDLRLLSLASSSVGPHTSDTGGTYVSEEYTYRYEARSDMPSFWSRLEEVNDSLCRRHESIRSVETYTEVVGAHDRFVRWIRFDDEAAAAAYLCEEVPTLSGGAPQVHEQWAQPRSRTLLREVPNT